MTGNGVTAGTATGAGAVAGIVTGAAVCVGTGTTSTGCGLAADGIAAAGLVGAGSLLTTGAAAGVTVEGITQSQNGVGKGMAWPFAGIAHT